MSVKQRLNDPSLSKVKITALGFLVLWIVKKNCYKNEQITFDEVNDEK